MPTTGTVLSKNMKIYIGGTPVAITCQVNATLSQTKEMFQITCKDSGSVAENLPGTKSWSISGSANLAFDATYGIEELQTAYNSDTALSAVFQTGVTGDSKWSGDGHLSSLEITADGNDSAVEFSFEITGTGALTMATIGS